MEPDRHLRGWTDAMVDAAMWGSVLIGAVPAALAVYFHVWWALCALGVVSVWRLGEAGLRYWLTDLPPDPRNGARVTQANGTRAKGDEW